MGLIDGIELEVKQRADSMTLELVSRLFSEFTSPHRRGLTECIRHQNKLAPYMRSIIDLRRLKKTYENFDECLDIDTCANKTRATTAAQYLEHRIARHQETVTIASEEYHAAPCSCWVQKH